MRAMKTSEEAERKSRDIPATEFCRWPIGENLWYQQESLDEHSHYHINPILHLTGTAIKHFWEGFAFTDGLAQNCDDYRGTIHYMDEL